MSRSGPRKRTGPAAHAPSSTEPTAARAQPLAHQSSGTTLDALGAEGHRW